MPFLSIVGRSGLSTIPVDEIVGGVTDEIVAVWRSDTSRGMYEKPMWDAMLADMKKAGITLDAANQSAKADVAVVAGPAAPSLK